MNRYSFGSETRLSTCDERLQILFRTVLPIIDHVILEGHRNQEDQDEAFRKGKSKLKWPNGKHNRTPSNAVDATPYPVDFEDIRRICYFGGFVLGIAHSLGIKIRWGNDWNMNTILKDETFIDAVHFELID